MKNKSLRDEFGIEGVNYKPIFIIIAILCIAITFLIDHKTPLNFRKILRVSMISMFLGLIIENYRIARNWRHVIYLFIGSYVLSLSWFLFNKGKSIEAYIAYWPYYYLIIFLFVSVNLYSKKITQNITEGVTLLFSLAFVYWLTEKSLFNFSSFLNSMIVILSTSFLLFTIFITFSYNQLSKTDRLILSIWTTIILLTISLDNCFSILKNDYADYYSHISDNGFVILNFFLLGVSSIYVAQNINLIYRLLDKDARRQAKRLHIDRFLDTQVLKDEAIICIVFSAIIYLVNFVFKFLPVNLMIWLVIFTFPFLLELKKFLLKNNSTIRG